MIAHVPALITANQLLCHGVGDYLLQSDYMAQMKTKDLRVAFLHATFYSLPFLLLKPSLAALLVITCTHAVIDRYRLARYVIWLKNWIAPAWLLSCGCKDAVVLDTGFDSCCNRCGKRSIRQRPFSECSATGNDPSRPPFLAVWLLIITDNILHVLINALALRCL